MGVGIRLVARRSKHHPLGLGEREHREIACGDDGSTRRQLDQVAAAAEMKVAARGVEREPPGGTAEAGAPKIELGGGRGVEPPGGVGLDAHDPGQCRIQDVDGPAARIDGHALRVANGETSYVSTVERRGIWISAAPDLHVRELARVPEQ